MGKGKRHTLGRHSGTNLNIGLFDNHATFDGPTSRAAVFGREHPFAVCFGQAFNRDHADAGLIVAAVTRAKSNTPSSLHVRI